MPVDLWLMQMWGMLLRIKSVYLPAERPLLIFIFISLRPVHFLFILTSNARLAISFMLSVEILFPQWEVAPIKFDYIAH